MHSGFQQLRNVYHTNFVARYIGDVPLSDRAKREVERVLKVWNQARTVTSERLQHKGETDEGFLFGDFGIADAFYWPVLWVRDLANPKASLMQVDLLINTRG
jgi:glutathione S-transferase